MRADYTRIAPVYDANPVRLRIPPDDALAELVAARGEQSTPVQLLDVGCGTGNYLAAQTAAFGARVAVHGLDASDAMLARAKSKLPDVPLALGRAEALPYDDGAFDYVTSSFAFHHFEDKPGALDEMVRVLRPGGVLRILNADPWAMRDWWVFRVFPDAWPIDIARFWPAAVLAWHLERRGLEVALRGEFTRARIAVATAREDTLRADFSEFDLLPAGAREAGLAQLEDALARDPAARFATEFATMRWLGTRPR